MAKRGPYRHRTLEERLKVHSRVMELKGNGKTVKEISDALGISRRDVSYWFRVKKPSRTVYGPDLTPSDELAYLAGAYIGDGRTAGEQDKKVRFKVADREFADSLNALVAKTLKARLKPITTEGGFYNVSYDSAVPYDFLQQPISEFAPLLLSALGPFLRGFFDAEGYASPRLNHLRKEFRGITVGVANTNYDYLNCVQKLLNSLGIHSAYITTHPSGEPMTIRGDTFVRRHEVRQLVIVRDADVQIYNTAVGFSIPQKRQKLREMIMIRTGMTPANAYSWFLSHYERRNGRWIRRL